MKVNPFKTTLYSSVLLAGLAATSVAAADEAKDVTATTDTDATVSNTTAESSANLVKTTGDAAVVTTVPGTEEKTTTRRRAHLCDTALQVYNSSCRLKNS